MSVDVYFLRNDYSTIMEAKQRDLLRLLAAAQATASELQDELASDQSFRAETVELSKKLTRTLQTPTDYAWDLYGRLIDPAVLVVAIDAGWISLVNNVGNADTHAQGISANEVAKSTASDVQLVKRLMRVLTSAGIIRETDVDRYAPTSVSKLAVSSGWGNGLRHSLRDVVPSLAGLPAYFKERHYQQPATKNGIYHHLHGISFFESLQQDKEAGRVFASFMGAMRAGEKPWFDKYPIGEKLRVVSADDVLLVDIGGSKGHDLLAFARRKKDLGLIGRLILQDRPEVLSQVPPDTEELDAQVYDFFTPQPVLGARAYLLKQVLHDWSDQECVNILGRVRDAMEEGYSRLLIHEMVVPDRGCRPRVAALDIVMLAVVDGGRERTESEWRALIGEVEGLKIEHIWTLGDGVDSVVDVIKV